MVRKTCTSTSASKPTYDVCSNCSREIPNDVAWDYCPWCGEEL